MTAYLGLEAEASTICAYGLGRIPPMRTYRLDQVAQALVDFGNGTVGKLVISME